MNIRKLIGGSAALSLLFLNIPNIHALTMAPPDPRIDARVESVGEGWIIYGKVTKCVPGPTYKNFASKTCTFQGELLKTVVDGKTYAKGQKGSWNLNFSSMRGVERLVPQEGAEGFFFLRHPHSLSKMTSFSADPIYVQSGVAINVPQSADKQFKDRSRIEGNKLSTLDGTTDKKSEKLNKALQAFNQYSNNALQKPKTPGVPADDVKTVIEAFVDVQEKGSK